MIKRASEIYISEIVGAMYYHCGNVFGVLLLLYETGELYAIDPSYSGLFKQVYKLRVTSIDLPNSLSPNPFAYLHHSYLLIENYNAILSRIEDIYGMSIEEFSLGQLEYM